MITTINEFKNQNINENSGVEYITLKGVTNIEEYKQYILNTFPTAFENYFSEYTNITELKPFNYEIKPLNHGNFKLEINSEKYIGEDLGIFKFGMTECVISNWGGTLQFEQKDDVFTVAPTIWLNLKLNYEHFGGGSNGCDLYIHGNNSSDIWYDLLKQTIITK